MTQMDADEKHEAGETGILGRVGRPGRPSLFISPLATNPATAGPLDHARLAAGGMLLETVINGGLCSVTTGFPLGAPVA
jgi:hypothetical protein